MFQTYPSITNNISIHNYFTYLINCYEVYNINLIFYYFMKLNKFASIKTIEELVPARFNPEFIGIGHDLEKQKKKT